MPRRARLTLPGVPWHIIQRGNNRSACFYAERDYQYYLDTLFGINRGLSPNLRYIPLLSSLKILCCRAALVTASINLSFSTGLTRYSTTPTFMKSTARFTSG